MNVLYKIIAIIFIILMYIGNGIWSGVKWIGNIFKWIIE